MKVSTLDYMMTLSREGYLAVGFQMFLFLKNEHNGVTVFNPTRPGITKIHFSTEDWSTILCGTCKDNFPSNPSAPRDICLTMRAFVDSDHTGDSIN